MKILKKYVKSGTSFLWFSLILWSLPQTLQATPSYSHMNHHSRCQIVVQANRWGSSRGTLWSYRYQNKYWQLVFTAPIVLGSTGIHYSTIYLPAFGELLGFGKREGDGSTPAGHYKISASFSDATKGAMRNNSPLEHHSIVSHIRFGDDPFLPYYNHWNTTQGEWMKRSDSLYERGFVLDYNNSHGIILPFKGSAIFIHQWDSATTATKGCIAMSQASLAKLAKWLHKQCNQPVTVLVQG